MALHTIHLPLRHRVMLRKPELRPRIQVALKTRFRFPARVYDELASPTSCSNMLASRAMATLAACQTRQPRALNVNSRMRAGGK